MYVVTFLFWERVLGKHFYYYYENKSFRKVILKLLKTDKF